MGFEAEKQAIASLTAVIGRAGLHSLFSRDFNFNLVAFQLLSKVGNKWVDDKIFIFPVLPNSISRQQTKQTSIVQTFSGISVSTNAKFSPISYSISGDFGLDFKSIPSNIFSPILIEFSIASSIYKTAKTAIKRGVQAKEFSTTVKNGYGCTQVLRDIFDSATNVDENGNPSILIFHNLFFGDSFVVATNTESLSATRLTTNYSLSFTAVAPSNIIMAKTTGVSGKKLVRKMVENEIGKQGRALVISMATKNNAISKTITPLSATSRNLISTSSPTDGYSQLSQQITPIQDNGNGQISPSIIPRFVPDNLISIELSKVNIQGGYGGLLTGYLTAIDNQSALLAYYNGSGDYPFDYVDGVKNTILKIKDAQNSLSLFGQPTLSTIEAQGQLSMMIRGLENILNIGFLSKSNKLAGGQFANSLTTTIFPTKTTWLGAVGLRASGDTPSNSALTLKARENIAWDSFKGDEVNYSSNFGLQTNPVEDVLGSTIGSEVLGRTIDRGFKVSNDGRLTVLDNEGTFEQAVEILTTAGANADIDIQLPNLSLLSGNLETTPLSLPVWLSQLSGAMQADSTLNGFVLDNVNLEGNNKFKISLSINSIDGITKTVTV